MCFYFLLCFAMLLMCLNYVFAVYCCVFNVFLFQKVKWFLFSFFSNDTNKDMRTWFFKSHEYPDYCIWVPHNCTLSSFDHFCNVLLLWVWYCSSEWIGSIGCADSILIIPDHSQSIQYNCRSIRCFFGSFFLSTCDKQLQLVVIMTWDQPNFCLFIGVVTKSGQCPPFLSFFLVTLFKHKVVQKIIGWLQPFVGSAIKDLSSAPAAIAHFLSIYEWSRIRAKGHSQPL